MARKLKPLSLILRAVVIFLLMVGVWFAATTWLEHRAERAAAKAWDEAPVSIDDFAARYPDHEANDSALKLESLVRPLGIDLVPRQDDIDRPHPEQSSVDALREGKTIVGGFLDEVAAAESTAAIVMPGNVRSWLEERRSAIEQAAQHLLSAELPQWRQRSELGFEAPIPNLIGLIDLQRVLAAQALVLVEDGEVEAAEQRVEACWRLAQAMEQRPELISKLMAMGMLRFNAVLLRHVELSDPLGWAERLRAVDARANLLEGIAGDAVMIRSFPGSVGQAVAGTGLERMLAAVPRAMVMPMSRAMVADYSGFVAHSISKMSALDPCADDLAGAGRELEAEIASWNILAKIAVPNFVGALERAARLELDLQLTALILEARSGQRPEVLESTSICPSRSLRVENGEDGGVILSLEPAVPWQNAGGTVLADRFTVLPTVAEVESSDR